MCVSGLYNQPPKSVGIYFHHASGYVTVALPRTRLDEMVTDCETAVARGHREMADMMADVHSTFMLCDAMLQGLGISSRGLSPFPSLPYVPRFP